MLWHQNPADQQKARLPPKLPYNLNEVAAEAVTIKELRATTGAGSDKLQLTGCEMASGDRHSKGSIPYWKAKRRATLCASRRWYDPIGCSNTVANPYVSNSGDLGSFEDWQLREGREVLGWPDNAWIKADPRADGDPDDVLQTHFGVPIYSARLRDALAKSGISGIQYLTLKVLRVSGVALPGFAIANIINRIAALDLDRSDFTTYPDDYFRPERRGDIFSLRKPVLRARALDGVDIFRLEEYPVAEYVSERFVLAFRSAGCTGYAFREVRTV